MEEFEKLEILPEGSVYDPNEYFFTDKQKEALLVKESVLLNVEYFNAKVYNYTGDNIKEDIKPNAPQILAFEDYKEIALELIYMYSTYSKMYEKFNLNTENPILDAEHILNLYQIGTEQLPPFDDITLKYINSCLIFNLAGRIYNAFIGFLFSLEKIFPENLNEIKELYKVLQETDNEDIKDPSLF